MFLTTYRTLVEGEDASVLKKTVDRRVSNRKIQTEVLRRRSRTGADYEENCQGPPQQIKQ